MSRVHWRWSEKDFGFRFKSGGGKSKSDFYQASEPGAFYTVPAKHRKLTKERIDELAAAVPPTSPRVVPSRGRTTTASGTGSRAPTASS
jgi:hypothetical protein